MCVTEREKEKKRAGQYWTGPEGRLFTVPYYFMPSDNKSYSNEKTWLNLELGIL